ncbi:nuclear transport factor 2 family protein [Psychromicrobium sp. YIM B11713]|uniref:nuclear transport factor 2 family protein n=1 Tax=Psychromicrobium sp. YIM B11713 TaxID=3145233 RepID=UPI00374E244B
MTAIRSPQELYRGSLKLLLEKDISAWVDLWAEDAVMEFPFAPPGWPTRLNGKAAVADYMRDYPDQIDLADFPEVRIHQSTDPETIIVEQRAVGRLVESDAPYDMRYIAVVTVRNEQIVQYRDYWNPLNIMTTGVDLSGAAQ